MKKLFIVCGPCMRKDHKHCMTSWLHVRMVAYTHCDCACNREYSAQFRTDQEASND